MATTTENLGLKNPSYEEMADIGVINDNMKIIDKAYGGLKGDIDTLNQGGLNLKDEVIAEDINNWLDEHPEYTHYAILDDEDVAQDDMQRSHLVQTNPSIGISSQITDAILVLLMN